MKKRNNNIPRFLILTFKFLISIPFQLILNFRTLKIYRSFTIVIIKLNSEQFCESFYTRYQSPLLRKFPVSAIVVKVERSRSVERDGAWPDVQRANRNVPSRWYQGCPMSRTKRPRVKESCMRASQILVLALRKGSRESLSREMYTHACIRGWKGTGRQDRVGGGWRRLAANDGAEGGGGRAYLPPFC